MNMFKKFLICVFSSVILSLNSIAVNQWDIRSAQYSDVATSGNTNFGVYNITATNYTLTTNIVVTGGLVDTSINASPTGTYSMTSVTINSNKTWDLNGKWTISLQGANYTNSVWKLQSYNSSPTNYWGTTTNSPALFLTNSVWTGSGASTGTATIAVTYVTNLVPLLHVGKSVTITNVVGSVTNVYTIINGVMVD